jgi:hypothetical protein
MAIAQPAGNIHNLIPCHSRSRLLNAKMHVERLVTTIRELSLMANVDPMIHGKSGATIWYSQAVKSSMVTSSASAHVALLLLHHSPSDQARKVKKMLNWIFLVGLNGIMEGTADPAMTAISP